MDDFGGAAEIVRDVDRLARAEIAALRAWVIAVVAPDGTIAAREPSVARDMLGGVQRAVLAAGTAERLIVRRYVLSAYDVRGYRSTT